MNTYEQKITLVYSLFNWANSYNSVNHN